MSTYALPMLLALAGTIGFVAHRASLCTVRAVAEILHAGTAHMLASFLKAAAWAALVYGVFLVALPAPTRFAVLEPRALAIGGAFVFGIGAAVNGGCSYSTLQRIADGDLWGLTTIAGMAVGISAWSIIDTGLAIAAASSVPVAWNALGALAPIVLGVLALLGVAEGVRLWSGRSRSTPVWRLPAAPQYRVATAAAVMGLAAGALYAIQGAWSYTNTLRRAVESGWRAQPGPATMQLLLFTALAVGMVASALQRGSFRLRWSPAGVVVPRLTGGVLMGLGASVVPGGNDTLILTGLPALSGWSLAAYGALLAGIAATLWAKRAAGGAIPKVVCVDGVCQETK